MQKEHKIAKREIKPPEFLVTVARNHYRALVQSLTDKGIYESIDNGAIEMLSSLYGDFRNADLSEKEKRESIKLYISLIKEYGGTPTSRQSLKVKTDEEANSEADLVDFMKEG